MPGSARPARRPSILIDARFLQGSGIARYLREVLKRLLEDPRFGRFTLLGSELEIRELVASCDPGDAEIRILPLTTRYYSPRMQLQWCSLFMRGHLNADVAFFPHYDAPAALGPRKSVVTIHDLTHFLVPDVFPAWKRVVASALFDRVVSRASRVLVTTQSNRRDLVSRLPSTAGKIEVVSLGVGEPFTSATAGGASAQLPASPYLLFVGNRKPHKNLVAAVEALAILRAERPDLRLVVAGQPFPGWDAALGKTEELGLEDALVQISDASDDLLKLLYEGAEALLLPSLYEGFGLPIIEAMACGTPVVVSNRGSMPEVVGDAGLIVDPNRPAEIANAIRLLHRDPELRQTLVSRGRVHSERFRWTSTAERTINVLYETALAPVRDLERALEGWGAAGIGKGKLQ